MWIYKRSEWNWCRPSNLFKLNSARYAASSLPTKSSAAAFYSFTWHYTVTHPSRVCVLHILVFIFMQLVHIHHSAGVTPDTLPWNIPAGLFISVQFSLNLTSNLSFSWCVRLPLHDFTLGTEAQTIKSSTQKKSCLNYIFRCWISHTLNVYFRRKWINAKTTSSKASANTHTQTIRYIAINGIKTPIHKILFIERTWRLIFLVIFFFSHCVSFFKKYIFFSSYSSSSSLWTLSCHNEDKNKIKKTLEFFTWIFWSRI